MTNFLKIINFTAGGLIVTLLSYILGIVSESLFVRFEFSVLTYVLIYLLTSLLGKGENNLQLFLAFNSLYLVLTLVFKTDLFGNILYAGAFNFALIIAFVNASAVEKGTEIVLTKEERRLLFYSNHKFE